MSPTDRKNKYTIQKTDQIATFSLCPVTEHHSGSKPCMPNQPRRNIEIKVCVQLICYGSLASFLYFCICVAIDSGAEMAGIGSRGRRC